jgi:hypothetical protein
MSDRITDLENALREIQSLVEWNYDEDADTENESPADNVAHVNGLVWQICERMLNGGRR